MKNLIVGTAGHIDHGKTTLIKALTGMDADRLLEEKKRGITIELGFAQFLLPGGKQAGIIDVPGHEKFIKNMLSGVGGIDIVLLVIAADEGFMPQTQEHLDILSILEIKKGIVVLTKKDLVDREWMDMVTEEIKEKLKESFLEDAPIVPVSAVTGEGIEELSHLIEDMTEITEPKNVMISPRIPIDRIFSIVGFGTVITGTQIEGTLHEGDTVTIYPRETQAKIRNIQVHGQNVKTSYAGQRVAINLSGIKKEMIARGDVLAQKNSMEPTMMIDIKINLLRSSNRILSNRTRLRLYHGSSEILCRIVLLDREELKAGESCYAQLRLEEKTVAKKGDHFVVRFYSPMETIGGGVILEPNPLKHKRFKEDILKELKIKDHGSLEEVVENAILRFSHKFLTIDFFQGQAQLSMEAFQKIMDVLMKEKRIVKFTGSIIIHISYLNQLNEEIINILNRFHTNNPLKFGMAKEEFRNRIIPQVKGKLFDEIIEYFILNNQIKYNNDFIALDHFSVNYTPSQLKIKNEIEKIFFENAFNPPSYGELIKDNVDQREYRQILQSLIDNGQLIKISDEFLIHRDHFNHGIDIMKDFIQNHGEITLSQFRDLLGTSRKYALPLIEFFDQSKITKRVGEKRILP